MKGIISPPVMSRPPARPLDGARVLVLSADPFAVENLAGALEDAGADVLVSLDAARVPDPHDLDAVAVHASFQDAAPEALDAIYDALPDDVYLTQVDGRALDRLISAVGADAAGVPHTPTDTAGTAALEPEPVETVPVEPLAPAGGRLLRAAATVLVVTVLLSVVFGQLARPADQPTPGSTSVPGQAPGGGAANPPAGTSELAGRVTRSDTNGSIGGATVVATGPSGPVATITDSQGRWRFTGLRGGRYVVMSTVPRFAAKQVQVDVPDGRAVENVNLSLDPEGS